MKLQTPKYTPKHTPKHTPKCSKCGKREAIIEIRYASANFCKNCFLEYFEKRVKKANYDFKLARRGDVIAVGVSGGKDSTAMLHALYKLAREIGEIVLVPVLVNEGIRGYRDESAEKAREACERFDLKLHEYSFEKEYGLTMDSATAFEKRKHPACSYCGVWRKALLNKAALEVGANKLAIGHNADDTVQTFLMNLMRCDMPRLTRSGALSGVAEREGFVRRIKPLVYVLERETALYCELLELPYYRGSCSYSTEAMRGVVKYFLNAAEEKHPGTKLALLNSFLALKNELSGKSGLNPVYSNESLKKCGECGAPSASALCRACVFLKELKAEGFQFTTARRE